MLDGYKTYLIGFLTDVWGVAIALQGDVKYGAFFLAIGTIAMTLRNAIANTTAIKK